MQWPRNLYGAAQVRELDRRAIEQHGLGASELMERAGHAVYTLLRAHWPRARRIGVVCGPGNNGGDGYVLARLAHAAGLAPRVLTLDAERAQTGTARQARDSCLALGVDAEPFAAPRLDGCEAVVDAIFGTGLERAVDGRWAEAIGAINASRAPVIAIDIPSGLHADTGRVLGAAVRADCTLSFIGLKLGLFTGAGREQAGAVYFDDLAVPASVYEGLAPLAERLVEAELRAWMPRRARDAHKGMAGHVLVVGGGPGMAGAAHLAGEAAYRAGAGLVSLAMHPAHATRFPAGRPELIVHAVDGATALRRLIARVDAIALGPGLGRDDWARTLCGCVLEARQPLVVDADALSLLGADGAHREDWVLTPHPGEAARLIGGLSAQDIQADRLTAVRAVAAKFGGTCVLKGAGTLISTHREGPVYLCDRGNPGMASGGMGDALTGVIAALIAQGLAPGAAARLGVWLHASAADAAAARGERGLLASDVLPRLRTILDGLARR